MEKHILAVGMTLALFSAAGIASAAGAKDSGAGTGAGNVVGVTAITEVFGDGQKLTAVAVEYDAAIDSSALTPASFSVAGRTVAGVYANTAAAKSAAGTDGKFVIVELSAADAGAALFVQKGRTSERLAPEVQVTQTAPISAANGSAIAPWTGARKNDAAVNLIVDDFDQFEYADKATGITVKYNLFVPLNYDPKKTYPLVMFIHDAGTSSTDTETTLIQGLGAVVWASPEEQAKRECLVLAPQFSTAIVNDKSEAAPELDATVNLIRDLTARYSIDAGRIYATGQSGGCMSSIALNIKYPDLFAASFLVAGQWDPAVVAPLAKDKLWIVVSEGDLKAYPGMNAITEVLEQEGAVVGRAVWDGRSTPAEFKAEVDKMLAQKTDIRYVALKKGTVVPAGMTDDGGSNHICTWRIAYTVEGIRDWLFAQKK